MSDATLLGVSSAVKAASFDPADEAAEVITGGPIPAPVARDLVRDTSASVRIRRLFVDSAGDLTAMESRSRTFPVALRRFVVARDRWCRTPWCGAPIRHVDHVVSYADGGETSAANGQGLCEACNYAKQAPGWQASPRAAPPEDAGRLVETRTPTGHHYLSRPPVLPGHRHPGGVILEVDLLWSHAA